MKIVKPKNEILEICKDDAQLWADAFMQITRAKNLNRTDFSIYVDVDEMRAWFANAIETAWSTREHPATHKLIVKEKE